MAAAEVTTRRVAMRSSSRSSQTECMANEYITVPESMNSKFHRLRFTVTQGRDGERLVEASQRVFYSVAVLGKDRCKVILIDSHR